MYLLFCPLIENHLFLYKVCSGDNTFLLAGSISGSGSPRPRQLFLNNKSQGSKLKAKTAMDTLLKLLGSVARKGPVVIKPSFGVLS